MTIKERIRTTSQPTDTLVWDPLVRFGDWALVTDANANGDNGGGERTESTIGEPHGLLADITVVLASGKSCSGHAQRKEARRARD